MRDTGTGVRIRTDDREHPLLRYDGASGSEMNRLSIIVPVLNEAAGLAACLCRLQALRRRGHEVLVVDGGSTDATVAIAQRYADFVLAAPAGRASQMNAGAKSARGDILLFLHADCDLPAEADTAVRNAVAGRAPGWGRFDVRIDSRNLVLRMVAAMMNLRSRLTGIATGDQGIFVTRALFERAGGFPHQRLMEDIALCRRLKRHGPPVCLRMRIRTSARRWEQRGVGRTILLMWRLRLAYALGADPAELAARYEHVR